MALLVWSRRMQNNGFCTSLGTDFAVTMHNQSYCHVLTTFWLYFSCKTIVFFSVDSPQLFAGKDSDFLGSGWGRASLMSRPFTSPSVDDVGFDRSLAASRPLTSVSQRSR